MIGNYGIKAEYLKYEEKNNDHYHYDYKAHFILSDQVIPYAIAVKGLMIYLWSIKAFVAYPEHTVASRIH